MFIGEQLITSFNMDIPSEFLHSIATGILLIDLQSEEIVFANARCARLLGYDNEEALRTKALRDVLTDEDYAKNAINFKQLISREMSEYAINALIRRQGGDETCMSITFSLVGDSAGQPCRSLMTLCAAPQRLCLAEQLAAAEEAGGLVVWAWDTKRDCAITSAHHRSENNSRVSFRTLSALLASLHPDDRQPFEATVRHAIASRSGYSHEFRIMREAGEIRWIRAIANCVINDSGEVTHLVGATIDFTKIRENGRRKHASRIVQEVERYVDENWDRDIRTSDVAAKHGISARALQRCFASDGINSFWKYVQRVRLHRARQLLQEAPPGITVTEVAFRCRFQNASHFSVAYRREFGEYPSETVRHFTLMKMTGRNDPIS